MQIPADTEHTAFSLNTVLTSLETNWQPFLLGCLFLASIFSIVGYILARIFWRLAIVKKWSRRKKKS